MKKKLLIVFCIVILVIAGFCLYMETHFSMSTVVDVGLSEEKILREMPEIAITENDLAMAEELFAAPEVQEAFADLEESGELGRPVSNADFLLADWTPEGFALMELAVSDPQSLYVSFLKEGRRKTAPHVSAALFF
ncbi:MAG: hypothetical protein IJN41_02040 [Firmicutes bacterium]|nr:hypothetical protein [Bacillota bacterium]